MSGQITGSILSSGKTIKGTAANARPLTGGVAASAAVSGNVAHDISIIGSVDHKAAVHGRLQGKSALAGNMAAAYATHIETYNGDYEVTPKMEAQTLQTAMKMMRNDVQVKPIPIHRTSNASGGTTVYIGKEVI
jgi:hypothetical protein